MSANKDALRDAFARAFGREATLIAEAPGRVNLIGEHTDYNLGFVLPAAIDRTVAVAAAPATGRTLRVQSVEFGECDEFPAHGIARAAGGDWRNYIRGIVWALNGGHQAQGADLAITGDVPRGAGLSSSAAIEVAVAGALTALNGLEMERPQIALLAQKAENEFVGVQCGIMDQFTAALGRAGHALLIDCRSLETEAVPIPDSVRIVIVDSKVPRGLAATAYNRRREECAEAARLLEAASLRDVDLARLEALRDRLPDPLYRRARHVVTENLRVLAAVDALRHGDSRFGELMYESHASLRDVFEVSCPELDLLVVLARETAGVLGARLTGAGFGGCTVNMVSPEALDGFRAGVLGEYEKRTGLAAEMHVCQTVEGLRIWHE